MSVAKNLARFLPATVGAAMRKRGFGEFKILNEWDKVVGAHLARHSAPLKIVFERGKKTDGALHIQVTSAMALEFQHLQPLILERIAAYFGYQAIGRLVLLQTQGHYLPEAESAVPPLPATPAQYEALESVLSSCEDEALRESLASLAQTLFPHHPKGPKL